MSQERYFIYLCKFSSKNLKTYDFNLPNLTPQHFD